MDEQTLQLMEKEIGISYSRLAECPFEVRCHDLRVGTGLCDSQYQLCSFYNARVIEAWREKLSLEKEIKRSREPVLV